MQATEIFEKDQSLDKYYGEGLEAILDEEEKKLLNLFRSYTLNTTRKLKNLNLIYHRKLTGWIQLRGTLMKINFINI